MVTAIFFNHMTDINLYIFSQFQFITLKKNVLQKQTFYIKSIKIEFGGQKTAI